MSKNSEILNAQTQIHDLRCMTTMVKHLFELAPNSLTFDEHETEYMLDQLDTALTRLDRLDMILDAMKDQPGPCDMVKKDGNIIAIFAGKHRKTTVSTIPKNGNGKKDSADIPNITA